MPTDGRKIEKKKNEKTKMKMEKYKKSLRPKKGQNMEGGGCDAFGVIKIVRV